MTEEEEDRDRALWASVPWTPVTGPPGPTTPDDTTITSAASSTTGNGSVIIGWQKKDVPYLPNATALQAFDIWIPASSTSSSQQPSKEGSAVDVVPPEPNSIPGGKGVWVVFLHGGAWRDPRVSSTSFSPTAGHILRHIHNRHQKEDVRLGGMISLNYRLSPHPDYPPNHPEYPGDGRGAKHPDHIHDVLSGISFLQRLLKPSPENEDEFVLVGHSCGATLAFQALMDSSRRGLPPTQGLVKPSVVVGVNGLYDLAGFIKAPTKGYEGLRDAYEKFVAGAFGEDESVWREVGPASAGNWLPEWQTLEGGQRTEEGRKRVRKRKAVLVQSKQDTLVPYDQLEKMRDYLLKHATTAAAAAAAGDGDGDGDGDGEEERAGLQVFEMEIGGEHDEIWEKGDQLARILLKVISWL
ncbi:Alpha/Beta hydrolase protein [Diplogelasinospora grovesii]|uniref:Kynurenine formamidase n=1 Tax=Diplogelasinospora grovesii TaxID=303347 RepID=A0AAN6NKD6_9PEZI|nr:Alpha/Beta hydrolase protein [Diplogelasinospora grovesii]